MVVPHGIVIYFWAQDACPPEKITQTKTLSTRLLLRHPSVKPHNLQYYSGEVLVDMESFTQCLQYITATQTSKSVVEKIIPLASPLVGVIIGATITVWREGIKDRRTLRNKKICVLEEIHLTRASLEHIFKETLALLDAANKEKILPGNRLPTELCMPFLDKYFTEVAYSYPKEQRQQIMSLSPLINETSRNLGKFSSVVPTLNDATYSIALLNLLSQTIYCHRKIETALGVKHREIKECIIELADRLKIESAYVDKLRAKQ